MALINTFSWKYCQLDVVVRRCSDSVSDHLGHVKVDICDLSRCTWKRSNGTACTVAYPPHLHGPVRISGNFVPDHFHPWVRLILGHRHLEASSGYRLVRDIIARCAKIAL